MSERRTHGPVAGVILVFLGIVFLLQTLGILSWALWNRLWQFWPVLLIALGLGLLLKQRPWLVTFLVILLLAGCLFIAILQSGYRLTGGVWLMSDAQFMKMALRLARRGLGRTSPNPMVGAVIVKDGRVIGKGYHHYFGGPHAEVDALRNATESVAGATIYVTLEPCSHYGKTPPCVDALIKAKTGRVVAGSLDPNPAVNGRGLKMLREHGIETSVGVLDEECRALNAAHFKLMSTGLPLVTLKFAQTLDGRIATASGSSRWISSDESRKLAHKLRATHDAVMVGIGTVLSDDPELTVRLAKGRNPLRVILDSMLRIPLTAKLVASAKVVPTLVVTTAHAPERKVASLREMGMEVLIGEEDGGQIALAPVLGALGKRGISSLLVEGGAEVITALLRRNLADRLVAFVAPKLLGKGIEAVGQLDINDVDKAVKLSFRSIRRSGVDWVIEADILKS